MGVVLEEGYAEFVQYHEQQLKHIGFPEDAWRQVYEKLQPRPIFDLDKGLEIRDGKVLTQKPHQPFSCVYIVPHLWSGDGQAASYLALLEDLEQPAKLLEMMGSVRDHLTNNHISTDEIIQELVKVTGESEEKVRAVYRKTNGDLILTVYNLKQGDDDVTGDQIANALNLPKASIISFEEFKSAVPDQKSGPEMERMYNEYVRKKQSEIGEDGSGTTSKYKWEDDAEEHVITVTIPVPKGTKRGDVVSKITSKHWTFGIKGEAPIIYGNFGGLVQPDECTWYFEKGTDNIIGNIQKGDHEEFVWQNLIVGEEKINEYFLACERTRKLIDTLDQLWYNALTYQAVTPEGTQAHAWYLPPKMVTKMAHSKDPSFRVAPFWSCYGGKIITLLWPLKSTRAGEACTLDKYPVLFTGEPPLQREARAWAASPANLYKPLPKSFKSLYENLLPPFKHKPSCWSPIDEAVSENDNGEHLTVVSSMFLSEDYKQDLKESGITVLEKEVPNKKCSHWKPGREGRAGLESVNMFDATLTNLIRLNSYIRSSFGEATWWPSGYHLNKELPAVLASPPSWDRLWLLRCAENTASSVVTISSCRAARMCENSLNYFIQEYVNSFRTENCHCSLEFTVVIRGKRCYISDTPAVHKAREAVNEKAENYYLIDHFIPRSDGTHFPSTPWSKYLVEFSMKEPWPAMETKIHHVVHDLLHGFVKTNTLRHCYGVQLIITPEFEIKVVGVNPSPTYFPSLSHLAWAWKLLYCQSVPVPRGFRTLISGL